MTASLILKWHQFAKVKILCQDIIYYFLKRYLALIRV